MGLSLNLLPDKEKEIIKWKKIGSFVLFYSVVLDVLLIVSILLLVVGWFYLKIQLSGLDEAINLNDQNKDNSAEKTESLIQQANKELDFLSSIAYKNVRASFVLDKVTALIPENNGIFLKVFNFSGRENIKIVGFSPKRDYVMDIKNNLEKSEYFKDINWPLSNFVSENNVDFSLAFSLK